MIWQWYRDLGRYPQSGADPGFFAGGLGVAIVKKFVEKKIGVREQGGSQPPPPPLDPRLSVVGQVLQY